MSRRTPEASLQGLPGNRARELAAEITGLSRALDCVTPQATTDQVHGRIDALMQECRTELTALYSSALANEGRAHG